MGLGDRLLDYIEGGPKLRKWYGQGERLPADGGGGNLRGEGDQEPQQDASAPCDAVLVTDADTPTGEFVVLQLILARVKTRVLVKNAQAASTSFGAYVTPIAGDVDSAPAVGLALQGAKAVIVAGKLGPHLLRLAKKDQLQHLVLPSLAGAKQGGLPFFGTDSALRSPQREAEVEASGFPYTIVRAGRIKDTPGGAAQLRFSPVGGSGDGSGGDISREDLARVITGALQCPPDSGLSFAVANDGPGSPPDDLQQVLSSLQTA